VRDLARRHGGAAKPTGAGGGDVLLALVPEAAVQAFTDEARHAGMVPLGADVSSDGVSLADPGRPS
jgi:mevalonate kinase